MAGPMKGWLVGSQFPRGSVVVGKCITRVNSEAAGIYINTILQIRVDYRSVACDCFNSRTKKRDTTCMSIDDSCSSLESKGGTFRLLWPPDSKHKIAFRFKNKEE